MAIPTDTTGGSGAPFAKLVELGDTLIGACGSDPKHSKRQARDFDSGEPAVKADGKPRLEEILHLIAMPGTTARTGDPDNGYETVGEGDHVRFALSGFKWGQVIDARKELPAFAGFRVGQTCSSDVYTIRLVGWSAKTENPAGATAAGFTVADGRIVMRTNEDHERWVINQLKKGANTNAGKDLEITVRRIDQNAEKRWEQAADELFLTKPWEASAAPVAPAENGNGGRGGDPTYGDEEPFLYLGNGTFNFRNLHLEV